MHRSWLTTVVAGTLLTGCAAPAGDGDSASAAPQMVTTNCGFGPNQPWLTKIQAKDGSFAGVDGKPDITATCLVTLALLGDGSTMRRGPDKGKVKQAVIWLRYNQRPDGTFGTSGRDASPAANSTLQHALATYTLIEAGGLSKYRLVWNHVAPAMKALLALRNDDGGWRSDPSQQHSDAQTTALSALACMSARFFQQASPEQPSDQELMNWFDEHPAATTAHAAMELFCRRIAGQQAPKLADRVLAEASMERPVECLWASGALYLVGGAHWKTWQAKLTPLTSMQVADPESEYASSFEPVGGYGRTITTALRLLTLEIYYRYNCLIR